MKVKTLTSILAGIGCLTLITIACASSIASSNVPLELGETYNIQMIQYLEPIKMKILTEPKGDWVQVQWGEEPVYININNIVVFY